MLSCPGVLHRILLGEGLPVFLDEGMREEGGKNKIYVVVILKRCPQNGYVPAISAKLDELTFTLDPTKRQSAGPKLPVSA